VEGNREGRRGKSGVGGEWKDDVEEPVFQLGLVLVLTHATKHDSGIDDADHTQGSPQNGCGMDTGPGSSHDSSE
jgi:hypothetical protein